MHGNFDRLLSLTYPARPEATGPRELTFHYGSTPGTIDGQLNRITAIGDSELGTGLATYSHMGGGSRRVMAGFGRGVWFLEAEPGDREYTIKSYGIPQRTECTTCCTSSLETINGQAQTG